MFAVKYDPEAASELNKLRAFDRVRILDAVTEHLTFSPSTIGSSKKRLDLGADNFIHQLRVGDYRIFYDVDEGARLVIVRHVRRKARETTGEIL